MTPEKIAELRKLERAASRAPWLQPYSDDEPRLISDATGVVSLLARTKYYDEAIVGSDEDAALIIAMRNNFCELLDALEASRKELSARNLLLQDLGNKYLLPAQQLSDLPAALSKLREVCPIHSLHVLPCVKCFAVDP